MEANEDLSPLAKKKAWWRRAFKSWDKPFYDLLVRPKRKKLFWALVWLGVYGITWIVGLLLVSFISIFRFMLRSMLKSWDTLLASVCALVLGAFVMLCVVWVKGWQPVHEVLVKAEIPILKDLPENDAVRYIARWKDTAIRSMHDHGIPASIKLAQGLLESGNGLSKLTLEDKNHFGIKCHKDWEGERVFKKDDEKGLSCFRKYDRDEDSFEDHSVFLVNNERYASLFELEPTDYKGWAMGLGSAGYATKPTYAQLLIKTIERYDLYQYD